MGLTINTMNNLEQQAKEQGIVLDKRCILNIEDVKHMPYQDGKSDAELTKVLEELYQERHEEILDALIEQLEIFIKSKQ
jgi:hypothetical protein